MRHARYTSALDSLRPTSHLKNLTSGIRTSHQPFSCQDIAAGPPLSDPIDDSGLDHFRQLSQGLAFRNLIQL